MPARRHPVVVVALAAVSLLAWFGSQTTSRPGPGLDQAALTQTAVEALPAAPALAGARLDPAEVAAASTERKVATPWASGVVAPPVPVDLSGARVELCVLPEASRRDIVLELTTPFVVHASAPVTAHHTFVLPPPEDTSPARGRLRLVLGDGSLHLERRICWKFDRHITLSLPSETSERGGMRGRILYQGRSAAGLATIWCERRGARIGACEIDAEGRFTLRGLPQEREGVELVIGGSGPTLELFRRPLSADLADIGDVELEPLTRALVLVV